MAAFDFQALNPDIIIDAIESVGIRVDSGLLALNSYENRVYQFRDEYQRYVVKFYRPSRWSNEQILEEHQLSFELVENEIPVVAPLIIDGVSLFHYQGWRFSIFPSVGGRQFEVDSLDQLEWMGRFIGRLHGVSSTQSFTHRPKICAQEYLFDTRELLANSEFVPDNLKTAFFTILDQVIALADSQYSTDQNVRLHGDCHPGNILWTDDGPQFVDLDDARNGPIIQDLWMMLSGDKSQMLLQLDTILEGYEEFASFDHSQLKLIEPLRALRMVNYMGWLAKRWCDPAFPRTFSWFNSQRYWEDQVLQLKEQLAQLHEPSLSLTQGQFH